MCLIGSVLESSLFAAILGGGISGGLTYFGVHATIKHEQRKVADAETQAVRAFRKAILTELQSILSHYLESVGNELGKHTKDQPFMVYYQASEDYFTIFNSNAHLIGKVEDDALRSEIVRTYSRAKGLLDSLRLNNSFVRGYEEFHEKARHSRQSPDEQKRDQYLFQLKQYIPRLLTQHTEFVQHAEALIRALDQA